MMSNKMPLTHELANTIMAQVFAIVCACPYGRVTTYSWIGKALGYPRGARMIGWVMKEVPSGVPAHRVISSKGELTGSWAFEQPGGMRQRLEGEGIIFSSDGTVDLKHYGWDPLQELDAENLQHIREASDSSVRASERLLNLLRYDPASPFKKQ